MLVLKMIITTIRSFMGLMKISSLLHILSSHKSLFNPVRCLGHNVKNSVFCSDNGNIFKL